jgi:hypothetical protein
MNKFFVAVGSIFIVLCMYGCDIRANRIHDASIELGNEEDFHRRLTLSTGEARAAMSECPVCAAPEEQKSPFATFFSAISSFLTRIGNGFMRWLQGEPGNVYNVDREVLPVFANASLQLTSFADRLQQQAVALDDNVNVPEVLPWIYRSSAANTQALAAYFDSLMMEISASGKTMNSETLECHMSRITDFMFKNTFPNMITLMETFVAAKNTWLSGDVVAASPVVSLESSLQSLYPFSDKVQCLADEEDLQDGSLSSPANTELFVIPAQVDDCLDICISPGALLFIAVLIILSAPLIFLINLVNAIIRLPAAVIRFILSFLGFGTSMIMAVDSIDPNTEESKMWTLLVEILQASPLTSGVNTFEERMGPEWQCEAEALMCQLDAWQQAIPPF